MQRRSIAPPGYVLQSEDSSYWAECEQFAHWRSLDLEQKVELIEGWNADVEDFQAATILREHPDASAEERLRLAAEARYGREFVSRFTALARSERAER